MLHVHCGDCSADSLRQSGVLGEVVVWTELLTDGPLRADVSEDTWRSIRAQYLSGTTGGAISVAACEKRLSSQDKALEAFSGHEEVVLWFDACLFDQTILARHLAWFARRDLGSARLSLICVGEFPGFEKFCGLGELMPEQLASLLPTRHPVSPDELRLGTQAWAALCSPVPTAIERLLRGDTSALPYLHDALKRHLEQFPSTRNGLNRLENEALQVLAAGALTLGHIFAAVSAKEERPFFGDTYLWGCLARLATSPVPALEVQGPGPLPLWQPENIGRWSVRLTPFGHDVLEGKKDWVRLNGIDRWLGGVHLVGEEAQWRWDEGKRRLVRGG